MRRPLAVATAALLGAVVAVMTGAAPAHAEVRYRAVKSCTVDGKTFSADIHTYSKPTPTTSFKDTEVQLWGYRFAAGLDATYVEALKMFWRNDTWVYANGIGYDDPSGDGKWHNGPILGKHLIGYLAGPTTPSAVLVRAYTGGFDHNSCHVVLRPADLQPL